MKLNPVILLIVVSLAVYIGMNINKEQPSRLKDESIDTVESEDLATKEVLDKQPNVKPSGLTPEYFMNYISKNGFEILPVFKGTSTDIYTGKLMVSDSNIEIMVDVYQERSNGEVSLVEINITALGYVDHPNQEEVENLMNKVAANFFIPFSKIPYTGSDPEAASQWVNANLLTSYDDKPKEKTSTQIGPATINIFGNPLFRTLEIDFGFADYD